MKLQVLSCLLMTAEGLAFLCGLATTRKWRGTPFQHFIVYLGFIAGIEWTAALLNAQALYGLRAALYNYLVFTAEFGMMFYLLYSYERTRANKILTLICGTIYLLGMLAVAIVKPEPESLFHSGHYALGCLLLLILLLRFFYRFSISADILRFHKHILFWLAGGWMLFYIGTLPFYGLHNLLAVHHKALFVRYAYFAYGLNILMYILFCVGFIAGAPEKARKGDYRWN